MDHPLGNLDPVPANGAEAMWNHRLRWRPLVTERVSAQFAVAESGDFAQTQEREWVRFDYGAADYDLKAARGVLSRRLQCPMQPARPAGVSIPIGSASTRARVCQYVSVMRVFPA